jgi:hypothetical protein
MTHVNNDRNLYVAPHLCQVGVVNLASFNARAERDVAAALRRLEAAGVTELELDLRDNRWVPGVWRVCIRCVPGVWILPPGVPCISRPCSGAQGVGYWMGHASVWGMLHANCLPPCV